MPTDKQIGRVSASEYVSRRPRSPLARGNGELPLPKPVRSAILTAKPSESGECLLIGKEIFCNLAHLIRIGVCPAVIGLIGAQEAHTVNAVRPSILPLARYEEGAVA
jgi:hypothetical protein